MFVSKTTSVHPTQAVNLIKIMLYTAIFSENIIHYAMYTLQIQRSRQQFAWLLPHILAKMCY